MKIPRLDLKVSDAPYQEEIDAAIKSVVDSGLFIDGPQCGALTYELSEYLGKPVVLVASGTDALTLALRVMADEYGFHRVVTTPFSFTATASAILQAGLDIAYGQLTRDSFNLDCENIPEHELILPVHLYGSMCSFDHPFAVEDACQAFGAFDDRLGRAGTVAKLGCFSFFPSKPLGAYGDAGAVCGDEHLIKKVKILARHGSPTKYLSTESGTNSRLDEVQAAILRVKLRYVEEARQKRLSIARLYDELLGNCGRIEVPVLDAQSAWHCYTIIVWDEKRRDRVIGSLQEVGIDAVIQYPHPLHLMKPFRPTHVYGDLKPVETLCKTIIGLPIWAGMTEDQAYFVCSTLLRNLNY